jgi:molybdopterin/thiamine biosynthesis adenylyltransferase
MKVSARHEGDLNKQLISFPESGKTAITLVLDHSADSIAVQHTVWMLANLAVRLDGYIEKVSICCPNGVTVHPNVLPFPYEASNLCGSLVSAASSLEIIPVVANELIGIPFYIGPGIAPKRGWRVYGDGWVGGITKSAITNAPVSSLPLGPYAAACFAAAEIFKQMRMRPENYSSTEGFFDIWNLEPTPIFRPAEQSSLPELDLECTLAGVGAVGTAFLHTMFACPTLKLSVTGADNDKDGLDITNLNRYVLFGKSAVGQLKPDAVCELLRDSHIQFTPWNDSIETLSKISTRVLSAVDKNKSREGIQYRFPSRIISASTFDLRVEVLRCGPPGKGACLRCHNPPEVLPSDDEKIAKLKKATADEFSQFCAQAGISIDEGREWINEPKEKCGQPGERLLTVLHTTNNTEGVFSVGFTSVLAGVLLAAEFIKDCMGADIPLNRFANNFMFQLFDVLSPSNETSFLAIDPNCPTCSAKTLAIWKQRFDGLKPAR